MFKNLLSGLITAFSMYSTIPMPQIEWNKNSMKYALCFFPLVGAVIGAFVFIFNLLTLNAGIEISPIFYSAIMVIIPLSLSGAIHLDGFIDTSDARYSRREVEKKLEILKDPHVGAFGVIMCVLYIVLQFSLFNQYAINKNNIIILALGFILTRALSALSIATFKTAKNTGLAHIFSDNADKKVVLVTSIITVIICLTLMIVLNLLVGLVITLISIIAFLLYKRMCYKEFLGITGDLAGFFVQILEVIILGIVAFL